MADQDIETLVEAATSKAVAAGERIPEASSWGFVAFGVGDWHPAFGGGSSGFFWFPTREDLLDFIGTQLAYFPNSGFDPSEMATAAAEIVGRVGAGITPMSDALLELDACMKGHWQFLWCGQFEGLVSGDLPFERELRADFRESLDDEADGHLERPIEAEELKSFIENAIQMHGI